MADDDRGRRARHPGHAVGRVPVDRDHDLHLRVALGDRAEALGASLAEFSNDPDGFATALTNGLADLADPDYLDGQQRIAPGIGPIHGVRWPLLAAVQRGFRDATKGERPTPLLFIADSFEHVFELVMRLKQICNFDPATGEKISPEELGGSKLHAEETGTQRSR